MKKYQIGIVAVVMLIMMGILSHADERIVTVDPTKPGSYRASGATLTNGLLNTSNSVSALSVIGVTNANGTVGFGNIPKLNGSGQLDPSFISASSGTRICTNIFLPANFTVAISTVNTNVMTYTTQLGSGAVVQVHVQLAYSGGGDHMTWRLQADGFEPLGQVSDKASTANYGGEHPGTLTFNYLLQSNITIRAQASTTAAAATGTIYRNLVSGGTGTPVVTNVSYFSILELK